MTSMTQRRINEKAMIKAKLRCLATDTDDMILKEAICRSVTQTAEDFKLRVPTVQRIVDACGNRERNEQIMSLRTSGLKLSQIAKKMGCTIGVVTGVLNRGGLIGQAGKRAG